MKALHSALIATRNFLCLCVDIIAGKWLSIVACAILNNDVGQELRLHLLRRMHKKSTNHSRKTFPRAR